MPMLWSEVRGQRGREIAADLATAVWVVTWGMLGWRVHQDISGYARAGQSMRSGGTALESAGQTVGEALGRVPVVGRGLGEVINQGFAAAAGTLVEVGGHVEALILKVGILLAIVVALVPIAFWLSRYVPWRRNRIRALGAAHRVIRVVPQIAHRELEKVLASRALHRLTYEELLEHSPDPFGDWAAGRFDRLARAELKRVGLRAFR